MKRILCTLFLLSACLLFAAAKAEPSFTEDGKDVIDIHRTPPIKGPKRSPALVPICAAYLPHSSTIELEFSYDIGIVTVTVTALADDAETNYTVPSAAGTAIIPAPSTPGPYTLSLRTETGASYCGQFIITNIY